MAPERTTAVFTCIAEIEFLAGKIRLRLRK
jgi:hypothetical protein